MTYIRFTFSEVPNTHRTFWNPSLGLRGLPYSACLAHSILAESSTLGNLVWITSLCCRWGN
jgi:hypothetical protein